MIIGTLDVKSLYTAIDVKSAGKIAREAVMNSEVMMDGINYDWALRYLALTMEPREIVEAKVQSFLPRRQAQPGSKTEKPGGKKPTILTVDSEEKIQRWWFQNL